MNARWAKRIAVACVAVIGVCLLLWKLTDDQSMLKLSGASYHISVMRTEEQRHQGLSGTANLPDGNAMVFVFPSDDKWGIWMKDMKYPIDIVWLNADREVVHTVTNAQPSSYPQTIFTPDTDSRYVLELPSGTVERTGIKNGDAAGMPSNI